MHFPIVSKTLPRWPNSRESIGRQIMTSRIGRRKAWWPLGPASEEFDKNILPEIKRILEGLDLCDDDIFVALYMIGRKEDEANPTIMICSKNSKSRKDVEAHIRARGLLTKYQGFGLGNDLQLLENKTPLRHLTGTIEEGEQQPNLPQSDRWSSMDEESDYASSCEDPAYAPLEYVSTEDSGSVVLARSRKPEIGGRLYFKLPGSEGAVHCATGGVILEIAGRHYQLTIGDFHKTDPVSYPSLEDSDECCFDGLDDGEDEEDEEDEVELQYDLAATSRGSETPEHHQEQVDTLSMNPRDEPDDTSVDSKPDFESRPETGVPQSPLSQLNTSGATLETVGRIQKDLKFSLDYALITLPSAPIVESKYGINQVDCGHILRVRNIAPVGAEERAVVVVTSSSGPIKGILLPGATSYRARNKSDVQKLFQVQLEIAAIEGDCGSSILDERTGDLYGHLILGGAGSLIAYFISAVEVFQDMSRVMRNSVAIFDGEKRADGAATSEKGLTTPPPSTTVPWRRNRSSAFASRSTANTQHISDRPLNPQYMPSISYASSTAESADTTYTASNASVYHPAPTNYPTLPCEFVGMAYCDETFDPEDTEAWIEHIATVHLLNKLPTKAVC
ncbi:hypothetical protein F5B20DRAFT_140521 [Whalleya microplaca]|nr:hypothetical protein F5B20DRAFT_140521 [Whalleya microplaca]